jgi:hypothetical protein
MMALRLHPISIRYFKCKRGTPIEIKNRFGNGEEDTVIGYFYSNEQAKERITLTQEYPPMKMIDRLFRRYCPYSLIVDITKLRESVSSNDKRRK